ncbi:MAG: hypothetical protein ACD_20C00124G0003 [uncultured bacterium]|nr:MAG: hypothetical protein ACD_20C00124G0003 [uncultured bacterium]HBH18974.1 hypothetical protein [Cyanobacteria bacterium UBA9579]
MRVEATKKYVIWFCLMVYFLFGAINLTSYASCLNPVNKNMLEHSCCCVSQSQDESSIGQEMAPESCSHCVKNYISFGGIVQVAAFENIQFDKLFSLSNFMSDIPKYEPNIPLVHAHYPYFNSDPSLKIIRTIVLLI